MKNDEINIQEEQDINNEQNLENGEKNLENALTENLQKQVSILQDQLLRNMAEFENFRKRSDKMVEEAKDYAIVSFAKNLILVYDDLQRALSHIPKNIDTTGIEMIINSLVAVFQKNHLYQIMPNMGDMFDYNIHEAISQVQNEEYEENTILSVITAGYKIKDRLIRPAQVVVSKK